MDAVPADERLQDIRDLAVEVETEVREPDAPIPPPDDGPAETVPPNPVSP